MLESTVIARTDWTELGIMTTVAAAVALLAIAFLARTRLPAGVVIAGLALCGGALGLGAAWIEVDSLDAGVGLGSQRLAAIPILALLTPLHVRVVLGPLGRRERAG